MEYEHLLEAIIRALRERQLEIGGQLATLREEQAEFGPGNAVIDDQISEKESELAPVSESAIENYRKFWKTLKEGSRVACPFCFFRTGKFVPMNLLPEYDGIESIRCVECRETIEWPVPL